MTDVEYYKNLVDTQKCEIIKMSELLSYADNVMLDYGKEVDGEL